MMENKWKEKQMKGIYGRDMTGVDWEKTWQWLWNGGLEGCTEALICSSQEQTLRTNYIKFYTDKTSESEKV